jgi:hypothetical protein
MDNLPPPLTLSAMKHDPYQQLRADLAAMARRPPVADSRAHALIAQRRWQQVRWYPGAALAICLMLSVTLGTVLCAFGVWGYLALVVLAVGGIVVMTKLNRIHRDAFIAMKMADGLSERAAWQIYERTYSSD